jgi:hypothetical protein
LGSGQELRLPKIANGFEDARQTLDRWDATKSGSALDRPYIAARDGVAACHVPPKTLIPSPFTSAVALSFEKT